MNFLIIVFLLSLLLYSIKKNSNFSWRKIFTFIMIGIGLQVITSIVINIVNIFISTEKGFRVMNQSITETNFIFTIISIGILGPIIEEYIFRKGIQSKLLTKFSIQVSLLLQSLIFGIIHFNLYQLFPTIVSGLIFGYFYYKFKSLYSPIILHISYNSYAIIGVHLIQNNTIFWIFSITALVIGIVLLYTLSSKINFIMQPKT